MTKKTEERYNVTEASWRPLHSEHAIERAKITVGFSDPLPQKLAKALRDKVESSKGRFGFGPPMPREMQEIGFGRDGKQIHAKYQGWEFRRVNANDTVLETVHYDCIEISLETAEYRSWTLFKKRFDEVIGPLLSEIEKVAYFPNLYVEYHDRFIFSGEPSEARPDELLSEFLTQTLGEPAANGGNHWHIHRGWFEPYGDSSILMNQNIDSENGKLADHEEVRSVRVMTKSELRPSSTIEPKDFADCLHELHRRGKILFAQSLKDDMRAGIGLGDGT